MNNNANYRVSRGGSWDSYARYCRALIRLHYALKIRYGVGFRLVKKYKS